MRIFLVALTALLLNLPGTGRAETLYFIHVDHLGTPRLAIGEDDVERWRWEQAEPFGDNPPLEVMGPEGYPINLPLRFPGQYADKETNLHYNYFRDYDSETGRYVQSDPVGIAAGLNTYAYVGGDPLQSTDPLGLAKKPKGKWAECNAEDDAYCRQLCGDRGVKSCKHWWSVWTEVIGGEKVQGWKPALYPSCNCNEALACGGGCKTALVALGIGIAAICILQPEFIPLFMLGAGAAGGVAK